MKNFRLRNQQNGWPLDGAAQQLDLSSTDSLFAMIDGQVISGRAGAWRAEVVSIVTDGPDTWVQVGRAGCPANTVVVHMAPDRGATDAIAALRKWTDMPEDARPGRIDLAEFHEQRRHPRQVASMEDLDWHLQLLQRRATASLRN